MRRRRFVGATGALVGVPALAGCTGGERTISGEEYPAVDEWLTETEVGDADETYDGTILDRRDADEVQVDVGVEGNHGWFAFGPSAVAVAPGTTVRWVWTDERGAHSVRAAPAEQLGKSDYAFDSGNPVGEAGHEFARTLDEAGIALYHCDGITQVHQESSGGPARRVGERAGRRAPRASNGRFAMSTGAARGLAALHYTPHLLLGMKGAVVVAE